MIHTNSIICNKQIKFKKHGMHNRVLQIFHIYARALTDREVKVFGKFNEMNEVRPRITELIEANRLKECGNAVDPDTRKKVRLCRLLRQEEFIQPRLF